MTRKISLAILALSTCLTAPFAALAQEAVPPPGSAATPPTQGAGEATQPGQQPGAATATQPTGLGTGEIIVTARRRAERLIDAPVAITALGGDQLNDYNVTDFTDIATLVPTLIAGRAASGSSASIFLRGVGSTALSAGFDQSVSFVIDGMPMSRGREINLTQYDVQRVEVLKGPQALFFGKNTTGGLISVTTANPTDEFEASLRAGYGFEAKEKYAEGVLSGPLSDTFQGRIAFRVSDSKGAFENSADPVSTDPLGREQFRDSSRRGASETKSGRVTLEWEPSSTFNLQLKAGYTDQEDGGPTDIVERICGGGRTVPAASNGIPPSPRSDCRINGVSDAVGAPVVVAAANYRYARNGQLYSDLKSGFGILTGNLSLDQFDVTSITSYYKFKQNDLNNVAGQSYPSTFTQLADFRQFAEEVRVQTTFDGPLNALFGAFFSDTRFKFNTDAYIFPIPIDPVTGTAVTFKRDNGFDGESLSGFGELTYAFAEDFELSAGARWSRETRDSFQRSLPAARAFAGFFPPDIELRDKFKDEDVSPQVTLRYKPERNTTFYAAYKEGFKSGGFNISQTLTPASSVAAGRFGSESARGGEVGARTIQADGQLRLSATAYYYVYKDLQVQTFDPVTIGQIVANAGKLHTRGIEGDFNWDTGTGLSFRGAAAYNNAEYRDYVGQCYGGQTIAEGCNLLPNPATGAFNAQDYDGRTPPKAPKFAGRVGASYETPVSSSLKLELDGDVIYTSKYNFTDTLRPDGVQEGFARIDAAARLIGPDNRWSVALIGRNLTNELVATAGNDIPFTGGTGTGTNTGVLSDMSTFIDNPREIYLEFVVRF